MSLLCWNCRRLGNQQTENQLANMVWAKDPSVVFLIETWTDEERLNRVQDRLKFKHKFIALRRNKSRGLVIFWKEDFDLTIETFSKNHIDATIKKNQLEEWRLTGFYGEPDTRLRHEAWSKLRNLKSRGTIPWLYAGDFNEIAKQFEKKGMGEQDLIQKCKIFGIYLMNMALWTWVLWGPCSCGASTLIIT